MKLMVKDIYNMIDSFAPFNTQCSWDNSGLLIGNENNSVTKIGVALDATLQAIDEAVKNGCDLLVTHHPIIFHPVSSVDFGTPVSVAIQNNLPVISAHTNFDLADGGVNYALAKIIGLNDIKNLSDDNMILFTGNAEFTDAKSFAAHLNKTLGAGIKYTDSGKNIKTVAVCGGAAGEYLYPAAAMGIDAFVTGEIHHHEYNDAKRLGISVFCCGHYETENPAMKIIADKIKDTFDVEVILLDTDRPAEYYGE